MLLLSSFLLILLLSSFITYYTATKRKYLSPMIGMMESMTNAMMTSITIGTIIGITLPNKDLAIPTIISVTTGMIVGYLTGRPISLMASLDGIAAGIMGGMMGAMLGVMLSPESAQLMVYFIDIIDVLLSVLMLRLIDEEIITNQKDYPSNKPLLVNLILLIALLVLMVLLLNLNLTLF